MTGKTNIVHSPIAAHNRDALALTMLHETGHAYFNVLGLKSIEIDTNKYKIGKRFADALDSTEHFAMYKLEAFSAGKNKMYASPLNSLDRMNRFYKNLIGGPEIKLIDQTYNKLFPVFNRIIK